MMNSIINTTLILVSILISASCIAQTSTKLWYAGVTAGIGDIDFDEDITVNDKGPKYGLVVGYQLKEWLFLEAEFTRHQTKKRRYEDSYSSSIVVFTQNSKFAFMGLRATKHLSDVFGFTTRLGAGYTTYESNFENESMLAVSSAVGVVWRIKRIKNFTVTQELQQIKYPILNGRNENDVSFNLSIKYRF